MLRTFLIVILIIACLPSIVLAQTIKIASVAPESTPWGAGLNEMAAEWSKISNGRVRVTVFHGGVAGTELDAVRKMRLGQIHGVSVSPVGLGGMVYDIWGMQIPGVMQSKDELDYVLNDIVDDLNAVYREAGYEVLTWTTIGWMHFFSTEEIREPSDLVGLKVGASDWPEDFITVLQRDFRMQPVATSTIETLTALNSSLLNTVIYSPLGVASLQWFGIADKMSDLQIAPLFGAIVLDERAWRRIPSQYHDEFKEVANRIGRDIESQLDALESRAISVMVDNGLEILETSNSQKSVWQKFFDDARLSIEDKFFQAPIMQKMLVSRNEFRSQ